jgi:hypothetical protein
LEDAAGGLIDPSLHQRQEMLEAFKQTFGSTYSVRDCSASTACVA